MADQVPIQLREMLSNDSQWDFDVIRLEKLTGKRPLVWLGMTIMTRLEVTQTLRCDEATLQNWLTVIEANYHQANAYHNSTHAADVLQVAAGRIFPFSFPHRYSYTCHMTQYRSYDLMQAI